MKNRVRLRDLTHRLRMETLLRVREVAHEAPADASAPPTAAGPAPGPPAPRGGSR